MLRQFRHQMDGFEFPVSGERVAGIRCSVALLTTTKTDLATSARQEEPNFVISKKGT